MIAQCFMDNLEKIFKLQKIRCPVKLHLPEKCFIVEIQYFLEIEEAILKEGVVDLIAFAISADGHELLVHPHENSGTVLQREFGDIDSIDATLEDLLKATTVFLGEPSNHPM